MEQLKEKDEPTVSTEKGSKRKTEEKKTKEYPMNITDEKHEKEDDHDKKKSKKQQKIQKKMKRCKF